MPKHRKQSNIKRSKGKLYQRVWVEMVPKPIDHSKSLRAMGMASELATLGKTGTIKRRKSQTKRKRRK